MKLNIKLDGVIVDTIEVLDGNYIDSMKYNILINEYRSNSISSDLRVQIPDKLRITFGSDSYSIQSVNGVDLSQSVPNDNKCIIKFPNLLYEFSDLNKNIIYEFEGLEFNEVICLASIIKIHKSPYKTIVHNYYRLVNDVIYGKKIFYKEYQSGIKEFQGNSGTFQMQLNRKDKSIINKLTPIVMELNKIENRVIPNWIYMNPVEFEFTEFGHLTGKLYRNIGMNCSNNFNELWRLDAEKLLGSLKKLPLITNIIELKKYDTVNPLPEKGSILTGMNKYETLDDYLESFRYSINIR